MPVTKCGKEGYICRDCSAVIGHSFNSIAQNSVRRKGCYMCGDNDGDLDMLPLERLERELTEISGWPSEGLRHMNEPLYTGHTAPEVIELMGMVAAQYDIHSVDEVLRIVRKGYALLKDQASKLDNHGLCVSLEQYEGVRRERDAALLRLDAALMALRNIHNTPPKLSEAREQDQDWWIALVDDMMGQAGAAIQANGVENPLHRCPECNGIMDAHLGSCSRAVERQSQK